MNEQFIMQELLTLVSRPNNDIQTRIELLKVGVLHNISVSLKNIVPKSDISDALKKE